MKFKITIIFLFLSLNIIFFGNQKAFAHCDSMEGPMIPEIQKALQDNNIIPVLKWVKEEKASEIKKIFEKTVRVSKAGGETKELAEMYFIETLVRIHRAGEGAPYTGIKEGQPVDPAVIKGDKALEVGKVDELANLLSSKIKESIQNRFQKAYALKKDANKNVEIGRKYVEAYVDYIHFVENVHKLIKSSGHDHSNEKEKNTDDEHKH
ncbi:MAG TPA: DUF6448 family protein [bacterium]|nr:DUF6448 family protein [bacterium]